MKEFTDLFQSNHYSVSDMVRCCCHHSCTRHRTPSPSPQAAGLAELFLHRRFRA